MKPIKKLVAVIALVGAFGPARALDRISALGLPMPATGVPAGFSIIPSHSMPYSFADICHLTIANQYPMTNAGVAAPMPADGIAPAWFALTRLPPTLYDGASIMNAAAAPDSSMIGLANVLGADAALLRTPPNADRQGAGDSLFPLAAMPEPADWMLLGGFAIMVAMAMRRRDWPTANGSALGNSARRDRAADPASRSPT